MHLTQLVDKLELQCLTPVRDREVSGCYASDLLNDVFTNGRDGTLWITVQTHRYVAAVATLLDFAAVVLTGGRQPEPELLELAQQEGVCLLATPMCAFEVAGRLFVAGVAPATCVEEKAAGGQQAPSAVRPS